MNVQVTKEKRIGRWFIEKASLDEVDDIDKIESKTLHKDQEANR